MNEIPLFYEWLHVPGMYSHVHVFDDLTVIKMLCFCRYTGNSRAFLLSSVSFRIPSHAQIDGVFSSAFL